MEERDAAAIVRLTVQIANRMEALAVATERLTVAVERQTLSNNELADTLVMLLAQHKMETQQRDDYYTGLAMIAGQKGGGQ
jgi:hypothetical protein